MALSYNSVVPEGVAIRVMTSQSIVLSGEGAKVSEMTPRKLESPFLTFSVVPEEPSVFSKTKKGMVRGGGESRETTDSANLQTPSCRRPELNKVAQRRIKYRVKGNISKQTC